MRALASPLSSVLVLGIAACATTRPKIEVAPKPRRPIEVVTNAKAKKASEAKWTPERGGYFNAIAGRGDDDVWAVGESIDTTKPAPIAHWDGKAWSEVALPFPSAPLTDVAVDDNGTVWVVGRDVLADRTLTAPTWHTYALPSFPNPNAYCCDRIARVGTEGWLVGDGVLIHQAAGGALVVDANSSIEQSHGAIFGVAPDDVFRATSNRVFHWDGSTWTTLPPVPGMGPPHHESVYAMWGTAGQRLWMPMGGGNVLEWTGTIWRSKPAPGPGPGSPGRWRCSSISGVSATDIWCAGEAGAIGHFDGSEWNRVRPPGVAGMMDLLSGIYATSHHVWVVGRGIWRLDRE